MAKQLLNQGMVLDFLKKGKTVQEISKETGAKPNAVYTSIQRLKTKKLWPIEGVKTEVKAEPKVKSQKTTKQTTIDALVDNILKRIEHVNEVEDESAAKDKRIYELENIVAAKDNRIAILEADKAQMEKELIPKRQANERIKKLEARLRQNEIKLSEQAQ